ncbi:MAG: RluA family pseudouridine synthase [Lachnospiraceae bacterium]
MKTRILYEDEAIYVIYKPAGIAVQASRIGEMDVEHELLNYSVRKDKNAYVGIVHRLDQPVEGVLVVARTKQVASQLSKQLLDSVLNKKYHVISYVSHSKKTLTTSETWISLEDYMLKKGKISVVVPSQTPDAKIALLRYKLLDQREETAFLDVEIQTGRFHQIRTQFASRNLPIVGDMKYGTEQSLEYSKKQGIKTVALCAYQISFVHPVTRKSMEFSIRSENPAFLQYS